MQFLRLLWFVVYCFCPTTQCIIVYCKWWTSYGYSNAKFSVFIAFHRRLVKLSILFSEGMMRHNTDIPTRGSLPFYHTFHLQNHFFTFFFYCCELWENNFIRPFLSSLTLYFINCINPWFYRAYTVWICWMFRWL